MTQSAAIPGLFIDVKRQPGDGIQIAGQRLRECGEYEYWLTIAPTDVEASPRRWERHPAG